MNAEQVAAELCAQFEGKQLRIGDSATVHRQELCPWLAGIKVPAPACHTGFAPDPARLRPTDAPADCQLCTGRRRPSPSREPAVPGQLTIDHANEHSN